MKVLTFTSLFPNAVQPDFGGFVARRMAAWAQNHARWWSVTAPVPFFPEVPVGTPWDLYARVPREQEYGQYRIFHPRYFMLPGIGAYFQGESMYRCSWKVVVDLWKREGPFHLIDAHYVYPDGYAAVKIGRRLGVPVVVSARGTDVNLYPDLRVIGNFVRWTVRNADACIAVCGALAEKMAELGAERKRLFVVPNGVDSERFQPMPRWHARSALGIPSDSHVFVAVGSLVEAKGHNRLIDAFARVAEPKDLLYIVGGGKLAKALKRQIRHRGLESRVFLVGHVPHGELPLWYNAADCSCLCSSREGWPNVIMESLACGTPVVATKVWGVPEIIVGDRLGILVESDVEDIARGLLMAKDRPWDRDLIRSHVQNRTWARVANELQAVFTGLVK